MAFLATCPATPLRAAAALRPARAARRARLATTTTRAAAAKGEPGPAELLKGAHKVVVPDVAALGCPDSESGMCEGPHARYHDPALGCPETEAKVSSRPHNHMVGPHLVHQNPAHTQMGCPESETGFCDVSEYSSELETSGEVEEERPELGAWEF